MPEVHIFCASGRTRESKVKLMNKITEAVVEGLAQRRDQSLCKSSRHLLLTR